MAPPGRLGPRAELLWTDPWSWGVPLAALIAAIAVMLGPGNQSLFLTLNAASAVAGPQFWTGATILGETVVALALVLPVAVRQPAIAWTVLPTALFTTAWVFGLKWAIDSPRPILVLAQNSFTLWGPSLSSSPSLPSGHAATAAAVSAVIALHYRGTWGGPVLIAAGALIAFSRIAVGVHWPLDVLTGIFGGWLSAVLGYRLTQRSVTGQPRHSHHWTVLVFFGPPVALLFGYNAGQPQASAFAFAVGAVTLILGIIGWHQYNRANNTPPR